MILFLKIFTVLQFHLIKLTILVPKMFNEINRFIKEISFDNNFL